MTNCAPSNSRSRSWWRHIRRAAGKAVEKVKELVRGPQPEPADPSAEPPKAERPKAQPGGDRGADDTWMPGDDFLGRGH